MLKTSNYKCIYDKIIDTTIKRHRGFNNNDISMTHRRKCFASVCFENKLLEKY